MEDESQFLLLKADCIVKTKETSEKGKMEKDALDINLIPTGKQKNLYYSFQSMKGYEFSFALLTV